MFQQWYCGSSSLYQSKNHLLQISFMSIISSSLNINCVYSRLGLLVANMFIIPPVFSNNYVYWNNGTKTWRKKKIFYPLSVLFGKIFKLQMWSAKINWKKIFQHLRTLINFSIKRFNFVFCTQLAVVRPLCVNLMVKVWRGWWNIPQW